MILSIMLPRGRRLPRARDRLLGDHGFVCNGVVGLCLITGRHCAMDEQGFRLPGRQRLYSSCLGSSPTHPSVLQQLTDEHGRAVLHTRPARL